MGKDYQGYCQSSQSLDIRTWLHGLNVEGHQKGVKPLCRVSKHVTIAMIGQVTRIAINMNRAESRHFHSAIARLRPPHQQFKYCIMSFKRYALTKSHKGPAN